MSRSRGRLTLTVSLTRFTSLKLTLTPTPTLTLTLTFTLVLAVLAACAGRTAEEERFTLSEENGVTVAATRGGALYPAPVVRFEPELILREDPAKQESLLASPNIFTMGPDGRFYVPERRSGEIAVFAPDGSYLRRIGQAGEGPGDFISPNVPSFENGRIAIWDFQQQRTTYFSMDYALLEVVTRPVNTLVIGMRKEPDGTLIMRDISSRDMDDFAYTSQSITTISTSGDTLARVQTAFVKSSMISRIEVLPGEFSTMSTGIPFSTDPTAWDVPGRGILLCNGDRPELEWYDFRGNLQRIIRTGLEPHPITTGVKQAYEQRVREARAERARARGREPEPLPDYPYPDACAYFGWGFVDDAGWIWLTDVWTDYQEPDKATTTFHVIDDEGRYIGTTEIPATRFTIVEGRLLATIEDSETGALVPTVFRIVPNADGLIYP